MEHTVYHITDTSQYINLTTSAGVSGSLLITNTSAHTIYVAVSATQPTSDSKGILCNSTEEVFVNNPNGKYVWVKAQWTGEIVIQTITQGSAEAVVAMFPQALLTSGPEGYQRLRVDGSETSFFLGESFRTFYDYSLATSASTTIQFSRATNVIIQSISLTCDGGSVKLEVYRDPTPAGTFNVALPIIPKNEMSSIPSPEYVSQSTLLTGGTISGGTLRDILRIVAPTATAQSFTAGSSEESKRGVLEDTVGYYRITNLGNSTVTGILRIEWEERP